MKPGQGKTKGNRFESMMARRLSRWATGGEDDTQLVPSRLSGGWQDRGQRHAGDLAANGPQGEKFREYFMVELKHRNQDLFWALYTSVPGENIQGWWATLVHETEHTSCIPLLVCRQNFKPILAVLPVDVAHIVAADYSIVIDYRNGGLDCGIMLLETLLKWQSEELYRVLTIERKG